MSGAPNGWVNPKTNWVPSNAPGPSDFNRIEGNISAIEAGTRTLDPALAAPSNAGTLRQILSWIVGRIGAIMGGDWWGTPATTLKAARAHMDAASGAHLARAIAYAGTTGLPAADVGGALDVLADTKLERGSGNQSVEPVVARFVETNTRRVRLVRTGGKLTRVEELDGDIVVAATDLAWSGNQLTTVTETAGGITVTQSLIYVGGNLDRVDRQVS